MTATRPATPRPTPLSDVVAWVRGRLAGRSADGVVVTGLTLSSAGVVPGDLFVASAGASTHGAAHAAAAVAAGAVAVLTDPAGARRCARDGVDVPVLVVDSPRAGLGALAAQLYGHPARDLRLLAVTGTQGKTTTTRLAEAALQAAGHRAAAIGTVGTRIAGEDVRSALTTPEAPDLHALFAVMRERGVEGCAMEVSSHALVLGRVDGVVFDVAAFTNLGRDHLDFHADLEEYFAAKASLFTPERTRQALVNVDDEHGRRLAADPQVPTRTFSSAGREADWQALDVRSTPTGSSFVVAGPPGSARAELRVPGDFNVSNALCAVAGLCELGFDLAALCASLGSVAGVPGRLETVEAGQDLLVVVDYAHKPDAVAAVLGSLRGRTSGRILAVLGAGGDRDRGKRPLMGEVAARLSDVLVVTDDNPRTEDAAAIRAEVLAGARSGPAEVHEVGDRRQAIGLAVALASPGDTVVVMGKGHETGQEVRGTVHPFDDRVVAREMLRARAENQPGAVAP